MNLLIDELTATSFAVGRLILVLLQLAGPWLPLAAWCGFWTFLIDWSRLRPMLGSGAAVPAVLLAVLGLVLWNLTSDSEAMTTVLRLKVSTSVRHFVQVAGWSSLALICGAVQLNAGLRPAPLSIPTGPGELTDHPA